MEGARTEPTDGNKNFPAENSVVEPQGQSDRSGRDSAPATTEPASRRESEEATRDRESGVDSDRDPGSPAPYSDPDLEWDYYDTDQYLGAAVSLVRISSPAADLSDVDLFGNDDVSEDGVATTGVRGRRTRRRRRQQSAHAHCGCHDCNETNGGCARQTVDSSDPWRRDNIYVPPRQGIGRGQRTDHSRERRVSDDGRQGRPCNNWSNRSRGRGRARGRVWQGGWRDRGDRGRGRGGPGRGGWPNRDRWPANNDSGGAAAGGRPGYPNHDGNWRWRGRGQSPPDRWQPHQRRSPSEWWQHDCQRIEKPTLKFAESRNANSDTQSRYTPAGTQSRTSTQDCRYSNITDTRT